MQNFPAMHPPGELRVYAKSKPFLQGSVKIHVISHVLIKTKSSTDKDFIPAA